MNIQNISSVQQFGTEIPKDAGIKKLDVLRFRPNIIRKYSPPVKREGPLCNHDN